MVSDSKARTGRGMALAIAFAALLISLAQSVSSQSTPISGPSSATYGPTPKLPLPKAGEPPAVNFATVIGWKAGETPQAPKGFAVSLFAGGLDNPRWLYVLPNGDVLVAESRTEKLGGEMPPAMLDGLKRAGLLGRPVGVAELQDGSLLVADDAGNSVWRVRRDDQKP
jgi:glucose/arabinose dehydrogenase